MGPSIAYGDLKQKTKAKPSPALQSLQMVFRDSLPVSQTWPFALLNWPHHILEEGPGCLPHPAFCSRTEVKLHKLHQTIAKMMSSKRFPHSDSNPSVSSEPIMSSKKPESNAMSSETSEESFEEENILKRVGSLPLVCSVCDLVSSNYSSLKRKSSYLQSVCDEAEKGVKTITGVAVSKAQPLLTTFEPQFATANKYACRGLDTMEEKLPILQHTADQVVSDTKQIVSSKVADAKNAVTCRFSGVAGFTKDAVQGSVKTTASVISSSVSLVMGTKVGQMAKSSLDTVLAKSHAFLNHFLLVTDEVEQNPYSADQVGDSGQQMQMRMRITHEDYLAFVLSLLNKFQHYASRQSRLHVKHARQSLQEVLEHSYLEWKAWLIALYYTVTLPLRTIYLIVLFTVDELLAKVQENVPHVSYALQELQMVMSTLECLQDLCQRIFARVWEKMSEEEHLNALLNYTVQTLPFCFFSNHCKCRSSTGTTIKALKAIQRVQTSKDSLAGLQEPQNSYISPTT